MKKYAYILVSFFFIISVEKLFATGQEPDYLIYKGDTLPIFSNPLENYFETHKRPDKIFEEYGINSTACWRGYIAYWELTNDSLFLLKIQGGSDKIEFSLIFKERNTPNKIFAEWFNNSILNPYGKQIYYEHMGYNSIYEFEREFVFDKGILQDINIYDNSKSKKSKYTIDNGLLMDYIKENINNSLLPDSVNQARVIVLITKTTEAGQIDSVSIARGFNETLNKEAMRVVKSIPEWDVLYWHGKPFNLVWAIPVLFERKKE